MTQEKFLEDIQKVYDYITNKKTDLNELYKYLENNEFDKLDIIDRFAKSLGVELDDELRVALVTRLVNLRDDSFTQVLKKRECNEKQVIEYQEIAYQFARDYWTEYHNDTIEFIESNNLLSPFYRAIFKGVYRVGEKMSLWQSEWTAKIINGVNKELIKKYKTDEAVMEYLEKNNLFDRGHDGEIADRSYSMLVKVNGKYESQAYIKAFKKDVTAVIDKLEDFSDTILELEDNVYNQKWVYYKYLQALIKAFGETRTDKLVHYWAEVDRAWMEIKTPVQIGHPLEYYEDHFRKAVALEWD
ncbi:MAG TPA: CiaB protein, partial [Arcobacter sp.]|nr:CiaB protein [Arcobacter sp.]